MHEDEHFKSLIQEVIQAELKPIQLKIDPMYEVFISVKSFNGVSVWILKALILLGAAIGVIYGFIIWLKAK